MRNFHAEAVRIWPFTGTSRQGGCHRDRALEVAYQPNTKKILEIRIREMKYGSVQPNSKSLKKELSSAHAHKIRTKHQFFAWPCKTVDKPAFASGYVKRNASAVSWVQFRPFASLAGCGKTYISGEDPQPGEKTGAL